MAAETFSVDRELVGVTDLVLSRALARGPVVPRRDPHLNGDGIAELVSGVVSLGSGNVGDPQPGQVGRERRTLMGLSSRRWMQPCRCHAASQVASRCWDCL